jgi:hypothetical protein
MANCPHCGKPAHTVTIEPIDGSVLLGSTYKCIAFKCNACQKILSVQIDPIAVKADIVNDVAKLLGKRP